MISDDGPETNESDGSGDTSSMSSSPSPEVPAELCDTVFLTSDGTPSNDNVDFVLNLSLDTLPLPNRFCVEKLLGKGGFGNVYLATDEILHRVVAIKVPHRSGGDSQELSDQFLRESRAAARLNHPSIVRVLDSGESEGISWQVAEYVDGPRLSEYRIEEGGMLPARSAAWIVCQLADAVQHAHEKGVLHRDIKPDNILLEKLSEEPKFDQDGDKILPRLTDFGLARLVNDEIAISRSGMFAGTPKYMAPEQLQGKASLQGPWTDIYSLGVVLHELLTGNIPFPEADSLHLRISVAEKSVRSFRASQSGISKDLETICLKCLYPRPQDRYVSAGALRDDLRRFLEGRPTLARPLPRYEQLVRWSARNRSLAIMIPLLTISIVFVLAQSIYNAHVNHKQNKSLSTTLDLLTNEKHTSDKLREMAENNESKFRELAWNSTMRECLTAMGQKQFRSAWELLATLRRSHPENIDRTEYQLTSQELVKHFEPRFDAGHPLHEIAVIPGSVLLAVAGESNRIDLLNSETFERTGSILTDVPAIHAIAVSPDGKRIAVGGMHAGADSIPMIYSLETGERLQSLPPEVNTIESLMFTPDGRQLVCGTRYKPVRIFNLSNGTDTQIQTTRRNQWLSTSPDGTEFAALATSREVVISSFADPVKNRQIQTQVEMEFCEWISESRILACTHYQGEHIDLINIDTGQQVGRLLHSGKKFSSIAVSRSQRRVFAGRVDGTVVSCLVPEGWLSISAVPSSSAAGNDAVPELTMTESAQLDDQPLTGMVISDNGLYCCSVSGRVSEFRFPTLAGKISIRTPHDEPWRAAVVSPAGDVLIGTDDGAIVTIGDSRIRSSNSGSVSFADAMKQGSTSVLVQDTHLVHAVAISPDERFVGWSNWAEHVELFELSKSGKTTLRPGDGQGLNSVDAVCFSPDSQRFSWTGKERKVFTCEVSAPSGFRTATLAGDGRAVQYSPDSSRLACGGSVDPLTIFDSRSMTIILNLDKCSGCTAIEWHRTGESLLLGFIDGSVQIRSLSADDSIERFYVHRQEVVGIALSPDGNLAVSVDNTGQLAMWDARTGEVFGVLFEPELVPHGIADLKPDLRFVNSGELLLVFDDGRDGPRIHRWPGNAEIRDFRNH